MRGLSDAKKKSYGKLLERSSPYPARIFVEGVLYEDRGHPLTGSPYARCEDFWPRGEIAAMARSLSAG